MDVDDLAAVAYLLATTLAVGFQVALTFGAPWGMYAMGGRYPGKFPPVMRLAALFQAVLLAVLALIVLSEAGLVAPSLAADFPSLIWVPVAVSAISVSLNAMSRSPGERRIWVPVGVVLLASSLIVALAGGSIG